MHIATAYARTHPASDVKDCHSNITKDSSFHLPVEPAASSLRIAYNLLEKYDQSKSVFDSLERKVLQKLQACFSTSKKEVSFQMQKLKLCREYHTIRTAAEFHTSWKNFFVAAVTLCIM